VTGYYHKHSSICSYLQIRLLQYLSYLF